MNRAELLEALLLERYGPPVRPAGKVDGPARRLAFEDDQVELARYLFGENWRIHEIADYLGRTREWTTRMVYKA